MLDIDTIIYTDLDDQYLPGILSLVNRLWGLSCIVEVERRFTWRYKYNYCLNTGLGYIALHRGKVIGFRGFAAQWYWINGERKVILTPSDAVVDPDYRRYGVFKHLTEYSLQRIADSDLREDFSYYLNLSSNSLSTPGYKKLGWQDLMPKQYYTRFSFTSLIHRYYQSDWKNALMQDLPGGKSIEIGSQIDTTFIASVKHFESYHVFHCSGDDFYRWRYNKPGEAVLFVAYSLRSTPMAYMVISEKGRGTYAVLDYAAKSEHSFRTMTTLSVKLLGIRYLRMFMAGGTIRERQCLFMAGFVSDRYFDWLRHKKREYVLIRCIDPHGGRLTLDNAGDIVDPTKWRVLGGEVH